jgi:uncharacterized protein (TIGR03000 family)
MTRFKLLIPVAVALTVFLFSAEPGTAGHGGGGGGGGHGGGGHGGNGRGGYGYGHRGYYGGYGYGYGFGFYPGYYGDYGYAYYPGYAGYPVPPVVPAVPAVPDPNLPPVPRVDDPNVNAAPPSRQARTYTVSTAPENTARVRVLLPAGAQLWLGDELMTPTGAERNFVTPELTPGKVYSYQVKARWTLNGRPVEQSAKVKVYANKTTTVEFRAPRVSEE